MNNNDEWFKKKSQNGQKKYLGEHPGSKKAMDLHRNAIEKSSDPLFSEKEKTESFIDSFYKNINVPEDVEIQEAVAIADFARKYELPLGLASYDGFRELLDELSFADLSEDQEISVIGFLKDNDTGYTIDDLGAIEKSEDDKAIVVYFKNSPSEFLIMNEEDACDFACEIYSEVGPSRVRINPDDALDYIDDYMGVDSSSKDYVFKWGA